ncbi:MAG TPA: hypothetical protein VEJ18_06315, partial [Planctomycetota bacterium]|nr:hypothetical protein [Planctomycetota bacterium]
ARSTLVFYCGTGHEITTEEVVGAETKSLNSGIQSVLQNWETRLQKLRQTVAEAQTRGHHEVAEVFQRHIANMESRIQILREAFLQAGGGPL